MEPQVLGCRCSSLFYEIVLVPADPINAIQFQPFNVHPACSKCHTKILNITNTPVKLHISKSHDMLNHLGKFPQMEALCNTVGGVLFSLDYHATRFLPASTPEPTIRGASHST